MVQLNRKPSSGSLHIRAEIAKEQNLSIHYLDRILLKLQKKKLIQSFRGKKGGFVLAKDPSKISLWEIFSSVEDRLYPVKCLGPSDCLLEGCCESKDIWDDIYSNFMTYLRDKKLAAITTDQSITTGKIVPSQFIACTK